MNEEHSTNPQDYVTVQGETLDGLSFDLGFDIERGASVIVLDIGADRFLVEHQEFERMLTEARHWLRPMRAGTAGAVR